MPRIDGYGHGGGAPATERPAVLPKTPVKHRGRPKRKSSGIVLHNPAEFTNRQIATALQPRRTRGRDTTTRAKRADAIEQSEVATMVTMYVAGARIREVAARVGRSQTTVIKYLHEAGVKMRPRHATSRTAAVLGPKTCINPECGKEFAQRDGERNDSYKKRNTCTKSCAMVLSVKARGIKPPPPAKTCQAPGCGREFTRRDGERTDLYRRRLTCSDDCAYALRHGKQRVA